MNHPHVVVVGGGISGLAAAHRLRRLLGDGARITLVEQAAALGGKLRTVQFAGLPYDVGAEAFLVRRPEARALVHELGLGGELVHSGPARAQLRFEGRCAPLPARTLLGVPGTTDGLERVLSASAVARVRAEPSLPMRWDGADTAVGPLVASRLGAEVLSRLVAPLLGGVYAGRADVLGLRPTMPALAAALDALSAAGKPPSLVAAASAALPPAGEPPGPVFGALRGGMSVLVGALVLSAGAELRLGLPVRGLARTPSGWSVEIGGYEDARGHLQADGVLLAVPPPALRRLLAPLHPMASLAAAAIRVESSVIVSLALPGTPVLPAASGVLVAADEPLHAKAFTFSTVKWPHLRAEGVTVLRASVGRRGEDVGVLQADDAELVRLVRADLASLTGITTPPVEAAVTRWGGSLPQYDVGHLDRVAAIEAGVAALPRLAVAGAALHGVGIPACIATADAAAGRLAGQLCARV